MHQITDLPYVADVINTEELRQNVSITYKPVVMAVRVAFPTSSEIYLLMTDCKL